MDPNSTFDKTRAYYYMRNRRPANAGSEPQGPRKSGSDNWGCFTLILALAALGGCVATDGMKGDTACT